MEVSLFDDLRNLLHRRYYWAWLVLGLSLLLTLSAWLELRHYANENAEQQFEVHVQIVVDSITKLMNENEQILLGGAGLFSAYGSVNRKQWHDYIERLNLAKNYPGILGVGYARIIRPGGLQTHIAMIRAQGFPDYKVWPAGKRDLYTSIIFLEPFSGRNLAAFGYDMFSEANREKAMRLAGETGETSISGKVKLVQENRGRVQAGFLMYVPIYRNDQALNTNAERWAALRGFVYSPYRMDDLMSNLLGMDDPEVAFSIYDGATTGNESLMYESDPDKRQTTKIVTLQPRFSTTRTIDAYGHTWTISIYNRPMFEKAFDTMLDKTVVLLGITISVLLFMLILFLSLRRHIAVLQAEEMKQQTRRIGIVSARLQTILDTVVDGIITMDEFGMIETFNPAAEHCFGYAAAEVIGQNIKLLMPDPNYSQHGGDLEHYQTTGEAHIIGSGREVVGRRKDGSTFSMDFAVSKMQLGSERRFTGIARDISARKQAERALVSARDMEHAANLAKDSFLATMSHEIRTPLGGMMGMLELLGYTPLDAEQRETLQAARDSGKSLLRIVNDILDWSKIEAGKLGISPQPTSLSQLVAGVVNTYARVASANSLILEQHVDARLSPGHIVDPLRLSQVLNNFVSNALKFTRKGRVEVRAVLLDSIDGIERVCFSVKDTGAGIEKDVQKQLFQNYSQESVDTARMYGGTGLGLAICRKLANLMNAQIDLESAPGLGSTFSITLDLPITTMLPIQTFLAPLASESVPIQNRVYNVMKADAPRVLVVDDHPVNRKLLVIQLGLLGLRGVSAENGNEALASWRNGQFALVITDCHMPKMDGYELAQTIRKIEVDNVCPRTPIFAWTANALAGEVERCRAAGMDELLVKPTNMAQLQEILSRWLLVDPVPVRSAHAVSGDAAPIDLKVLDQLSANAADRAAILQDFMAQTRSDLADLQAALEAHDLTESVRIAHRMKGASQMVGAYELAVACAAMENAARQGDVERAHAIQAALESLEAHLANVAGTEN